MSAGNEANKSGETWESWVKALAQKHGFALDRYKNREKCQVPPRERRIVWAHAPYKTIFDTTKEPKSKTVTEFVIECDGDMTRIECKWQSVPGSVDEKLPFMYLNAVLTMPEHRVVFALGGEYFDDGRGKKIKNWLKEACVSPPEWLSDKARAKWKEKELLVHSTNTFAKWFREQFT